MTSKVTATDDSLQLYGQPDLGSHPVAQIRKGAALQLGASSIHEEREWIGATLDDGRAGYVLGPAVRSHTTLAGATLDITDSGRALNEVLRQIVQEKPLPPKARGLTPVQQMLTYGLICAMGTTVLIMNHRDGTMLGLGVTAGVIGAARFIKGLVRFLQQ